MPWIRDASAARRTIEIALAVVVALALVPALLHAAPKKPQLAQKRCVRITEGSSVTVALKKRSKPPSVIVAYGSWDGDATASLADTAGNEYASAIGPTRSAAQSAQISWASNASEDRVSVTSAFSTPVLSRGVLCVHEYVRLDATSPFVGAVGAAGSSAEMSTSALDIPAGGLLFVGGTTTKKSIKGLGPRARGRFGKFGVKTADAVFASEDSLPVTATQKGDAWILQAAAFRGAVEPPKGTTGPLRVSANGRYLVDASGAPFFLQGDSPQALFIALSEAEADAFLANRQAAGFNAIWVNLLAGPAMGGRPDASTYDGVRPFTTPGDLATPNEAYFQRVDRLLDLAQQHGMVVILDPAETIDFLAVLRANGIAKARAYGNFLGQRYRSFDNILWMSGNDFQTWRVADDDAVVRAVAQGIRDEDDRHLHTVLLDYYVSGSLDDPSWAPIINLNASYSYSPTYAQVLKDYNRADGIPTFLAEANYELEHNAGDLGTPEVLRRQAYWALLSGAAGHMYGSYYTWHFADGWQSHLDLPGSQQMRHVRALFEPRRWYDLVPDQSHVFVTAGYGTFAADGALIDSDYATAARTADGRLGLAYMPTLRTLSVDLSSLAGPASAAWYDPTNGQPTAIAGSPLPNSGVVDLTPPGTNAAGDGDWVLVLETQPP